MADFNLYAPKLRKLEGGFVNDPSDKGGATMAGVTLNTYRRYYGESKTVNDLKNISNAEWNHIMKTGYWDMVRGDEIRNQSIAEIFADWAVNSGPAGIRAFQRAQAIKADGVVGPKTINILNAPNEEVIFNRIKSARESYYRKLAMTDPRQSKFLGGWLNRLRQFNYVPSKS